MVASLTLSLGVLVGTLLGLGARPAAATVPRNLLVGHRAEKAFMGGRLRSNVVETTPGDAVIPFSGLTSLDPSDDGSSGAVALGFTIDYFGTSYSSVYVNNNGNLTFAGPLSAYTPSGIGAVGSDIVAPFFADVDTRLGNTVEYATGTLDGYDVFVADWPYVGCYDEVTSVLDDFQAILISRPDLGAGDFQIEFNYDQILWDAGQASAGSAACQSTVNGDAAVVGFSNSDGSRAYQLPGSQSNGAFIDGGPHALVSNELNSDTSISVPASDAPVAGRYIFDVVNGEPGTPSSMTTSLAGGGQSGSSISVPPGTAVTGSAVLSGSNAAEAGGTVTYVVYPGTDCTGLAAASGGTVVVSGGSIPDSSAIMLTTPGTYSWQADYTGDGVNNQASSSCSATEAVANPATSVDSTVYDATGSPWAGVSPPPATGSSAYDLASVSPLASGGPLLGGSVTFTLNAGGSCSAPLGSDSVDLVDGAARSPATGGLTPGDYSFQAVYTGDGFYSGSSGPCEAFTVDKATPGVGQTIDDAATGTTWTGSEVTGNAAYDTSSLSGVTGFSPTGTLTYDLYVGGSCTGFPAQQSVVNLIGGAVPSSSTTSPLGAGTYSYEATYPGDNDYSGATSGCQGFTVDMAPRSISSIVEDASNGSPWSGIEQTGATAYDTATITAVEDEALLRLVLGPHSPVPSFVPTGSVTYYLYDNGTCAGSPAPFDTEYLTGAGTVPDSATTPALATGAYSFAAHYSGDGNFLPATSACEAFTVNTAGPAVNSSVDDTASGTGWNGSEVTGASAYDTSVVSGVAGFTPTGSVTYHLYGDPSCSGNPASSDTEDLNAGAVPDSATTKALGAGTYGFEAVYSGDGNYSAASSACEVFTVNPASPQVASSVADASTNAAWSGTEVTGATAYDTATVGGAAGINPTGSVTYYLYDNGTCEGSPASSDTEYLTGAGTVPDSATTAPLGAGTYSFMAEYSGDANYYGAGRCEPAFSVGVTTPTVNSAVDDAETGTGWSGTEATGATAYDSSAVGGAIGVSPTGSVTYYLYGNGGCSGSPAPFDVEGLIGGDVPPSATTAALRPGSYSFEASYSGDGDYSAALSGCESFNVRKGVLSIPQTVYDAATAAPWSGSEVTGAKAYDSADVTGAPAFAPTGLVYFAFFGDGSCTGVPLSTSAAVAGPAARSSTTAPLARGSYSFEVTYAGDADYWPAVSSCTPFSVKASAAVTTVVDDAVSGRPWSPAEVTGATAYDTAKVAGVGGVAPTGSVTYRLFDNGTCAGSPAGSSTEPLAGGLVPNSVATGPLEPGSYSYRAVYSGDSSYAGATAACEPFKVSKENQAPLVITSKTGIYGTPLHLTVSGGSDGLAVTFALAGPGPGAGPGAAHCSLNGATLTAGAAGTCTVSATMAGDADYNPVSSAATPIAFAKAGTSVSLLLSVSAVKFGQEQAEQLTVTVAAANPALVPDGPVLISGTNCVFHLSGGQGSCTLSPKALPPGVHQLLATYTGSPDFLGSVSSPKQLTVTSG